MGTPYNDQWVLGRSRRRTDLQEQPRPDGLEPQERLEQHEGIEPRDGIEPHDGLEPHKALEPHEFPAPRGPLDEGRAEQAPPRKAFARAVRKRPFWIDRDT